MAKKTNPKMNTEVDEALEIINHTKTVEDSQKSIQEIYFLAQKRINNLKDKSFYNILKHQLSGINYYVLETKDISRLTLEQVNKFYSLCTHIDSIINETITKFKIK